MTRASLSRTSPPLRQASGLEAFAALMDLLAVS